MTKETGTPQIRFSGYNDTWEQRKFPEFVSFFNGLTYTPDDVQEMGTLVLRSSNVKNGEIIDADNVYVNDKVATSENVQVGDIIVVVRNGSRALIGKHAQIKASMPNTVIGAFMNGIRSDHSSFVNALLDTSAFENEIAKNMGATINQITGYMFSKMEFMVPSEEEQQQIGQFFSKLDHLITLHQRKYDKLVKVKKSMLEKMFPREGAKVPEIRFYGFTDDWEQRKFSEGVSEIGDGLHGTPIYCEDGNVYFINGNNLVDGKIVISAETKKVNECQQSTADKSLDDTTILMSINGTIGNLAYYSGERLMLGKSAAYIKVSEFDKRFVYAYLQAPSVQGYFMDSLTGTTIKNLGLKAIREMIMFIPQDVDEQKRIGKFFDYLDHLITLHQRKLEKLKNLKKACLKKMFI